MTIRRAWAFAVAIGAAPACTPTAHVYARHVVVSAGLGGVEGEGGRLVTERGDDDVELCRRICAVQLRPTESVAACFRAQADGAAVARLRIDRHNPSVVVCAFEVP